MECSPSNSQAATRPLTHSSSKLAHFHRSASLGGVESLAVHPAAMWRGMLSEQDIAASGVPLNLVRLAAGTEDTEDLVTDVLAAADAVAAATGSD